MSLLLALMACYQVLGTEVTFTQCSAEALKLEDCTVRKIQRLQTKDIEEALRYTASHKGWVHASCGLE